MSKKFVSFILAFVLIFSLIPNMPTYGMGEQVEKNEKNQIISDFSASTRADAEKEYESEEWLKIFAEQEKLITPEIRASMRENAIKTF